MNALLALFYGGDVRLILTLTRKGDYCPGAFVGGFDGFVSGM